MTEPDPLERLAALVPVLEDPTLEFGRWEGGDRRPDGSITMPYFSLSPAGLEIVRALPIEVFDWGAWLQTDAARALMADHRQIANATPEQLIRLTTALVRGDRFTEGTLASAFESGLLLAIARRAQALS